MAIYRVILDKITNEYVKVGAPLGKVVKKYIFKPYKRPGPVLVNKVGKINSKYRKSKYKRNNK